MSHNTHPVVDYAPLGSPAEQALQYPYARPDYSYFTDGETVTELPATYTEFTAAADEMLAAQGVPLLADRMPVLAYGANASPFKLTDKMGGKFTPEHLRKELQVVPSIAAEMDDTAIAWHGKPGQNGSVFAELYRNKDTEGVVSRCHVQFLTNEQIVLLHATEGETYHFVEVTVRAGSDNESVRALAYVAGKSEVLLDETGKPILVKPLTKETTDPTMTAQEAVAYMLGHAGEAASTVDPVEFVETAPKTLAEKKVRQAQVRAALGALGLSQEFSFPDITGKAFSRGNFNFKPHMSERHGGSSVADLFLLELVTDRLRPSSESIEKMAGELKATSKKELSEEEALNQARIKLDPLYVLRNRVNTERRSRPDNVSISID